MASSRVQISVEKRAPCNGLAGLAGSFLSQSIKPTHIIHARDAIRTICIGLTFAGGWAGIAKGRALATTINICLVAVLLTFSVAT
jgi:hypothetical protein